MTADERLEALLNRAGQTISDLPTQYSLDMETVTIDAAADSGFGWLEDYICHLADVIDRMETALVNVIGERDWLSDYYTESEMMPWHDIPEDWRVDDD